MDSQEGRQELLTVGKEPRALTGRLESGACMKRFFGCCKGGVSLTQQRFAISDEATAQLVHFSHLQRNENGNITAPAIDVS